MAHQILKDDLRRELQRKQDEQTRFNTNKSVASIFSRAKAPGQSDDKIKEVCENIDDFIDLSQLSNPPLIFSHIIANKTFPLPNIYSPIYSINCKINSTSLSQDSEYSLYTVPEPQILTLTPYKVSSASSLQSSSGSFETLTTRDLNTSLLIETLLLSGRIPDSCHPAVHRAFALGRISRGISPIYLRGSERIKNPFCKRDWLGNGNELDVLIDWLRSWASFSSEQRRKQVEKHNTSGGKVNPFALMAQSKKDNTNSMVISSKKRAGARKADKWLDNDGDDILDEQGNPVMSSDEIMLDDLLLARAVGSHAAGEFGVHKSEFVDPADIMFELEALNNSKCRTLGLVMRRLHQVDKITDFMRENYLSEKCAVTKKKVRAKAESLLADVENSPPPRAIVLLGPEGSGRAVLARLAARLSCYVIVDVESNGALSVSSQGEKEKQGTYIDEPMGGCGEVNLQGDTAHAAPFADRNIIRIFDALQHAASAKKLIGSSAAYDADASVYYDSKSSVVSDGKFDKNDNSGMHNLNPNSVSVTGLSTHSRVNIKSFVEAKSVVYKDCIEAAQQAKARASATPFSLAAAARVSSKSKSQEAKKGRNTGTKKAKSKALRRRRRASTSSDSDEDEEDSFSFSSSGIEDESEYNDDESNDGSDSASTTIPRNKLPGTVTSQKSISKAKSQILKHKKLKSQDDSYPPSSEDNNQQEQQLERDTQPQKRSFKTVNQQQTAPSSTVGGILGSFLIRKPSSTTTTTHSKTTSAPLELPRISSKGRIRSVSIPFALPAKHTAHVPDQSTQRGLSSFFVRQSVGTVSKAEDTTKNHDNFVPEQVDLLTDTSDLDNPSQAVDSEASMNSRTENENRHLITDNSENTNIGSFQENWKHFLNSQDDHHSTIDDEIKDESVDSLISENLEPHASPEQLKFDTVLYGGNNQTLLGDSSELAPASKRIKFEQPQLATATSSPHLPSACELLPLPPENPLAIQAAQRLLRISPLPPCENQLLVLHDIHELVELAPSSAPRDLLRALKDSQRPTLFTATHIKPNSPLAHLPVVHLQSCSEDTLVALMLGFAAGPPPPEEVMEDTSFTPKVVKSCKPDDSPPPSSLDHLLAGLPSKTCLINNDDLSKASDERTTEEESCSELSYRSSSSQQQEDGATVAPGAFNSDRKSEENVTHFSCSQAKCFTSIAASDADRKLLVDIILQVIRPLSATCSLRTLLSRLSGLAPALKDKPLSKYLLATLLAEIRSDGNQELLSFVNSNHTLESPMLSLPSSSSQFASMMDSVLLAMRKRSEFFRCPAVSHSALPRDGVFIAENESITGLVNCLTSEFETTGIKKKDLSHLLAYVDLEPALRVYSRADVNKLSSSSYSELKDNKSENMYSDEMNNSKICKDMQTIDNDVDVNSEELFSICKSNHDKIESSSSVVILKRNCDTDLFDDDDDENEKDNDNEATKSALQRDEQNADSNHLSCSSMLAQQQHSVNHLATARMASIWQLSGGTSLYTAPSNTSAVRIVSSGEATMHPHQAYLNYNAMRQAQKVRCLAQPLEFDADATARNATMMVKLNAEKMHEGVARASNVLSNRFGLEGGQVRVRYVQSNETTGCILLPSSGCMQDSACMHLLADLCEEMADIDLLSRQIAELTLLEEFIQTENLLVNNLLEVQDGARDEFKCKIVKVNSEVPTSLPQASPNPSSWLCSNPHMIAQQQHHSMTQTYHKYLDIVFAEQQNLYFSGINAVQTSTFTNPAPFFPNTFFQYPPHLDKYTHAQNQLPSAANPMSAFLAPQILPLSSCPTNLPISTSESASSIALLAAQSSIFDAINLNPFPPQQQVKLDRFFSSQLSGLQTRLLKNADDLHLLTCMSIKVYLSKILMHSCGNNSAQMRKLLRSLNDVDTSKCSIDSGETSCEPNETQHNEYDVFWKSRWISLERSTQIIDPSAVYRLASSVPQLFDVPVTPCGQFASEASLSFQLLWLSTQREFQSLLLNAPMRISASKRNSGPSLDSILQSEILKARRSRRTGGTIDISPIMNAWKNIAEVEQKMENLRSIVCQKKKKIDEEL